MTITVVEKVLRQDIERLRVQWVGMKDEVNLCHAELASLRASNAELFEALLPFAKRAEYFEERLKANGGKCTDNDDYCDDPPSDIYLGHLRKARAALAKAKG
jgi:hypothetical protein